MIPPGILNKVVRPSPSRKLRYSTSDTHLTPMANCIRCGRQLSGFNFGRKICPWCVQHEAEQRGEVAEMPRNR